MKKIITGTILCLVAITSCNKDTVRDQEIALVDRVAQWQMEHFPDSMAPEAGWVHAAFYRGLNEWGEYQHKAETDSFLLRVGKDLNWGLLDRIYDADDLCIGQTYINLYKRYQNPEMIKQVVDRVHYIMECPPQGSLRTEKNKPNRDRWGWCDALFMAPPVYAQLYQLQKEEKYLDFCFSEYQVNATHCMTNSISYSPATCASLMQKRPTDRKYSGAEETDGFIQD